VNSVAFILAAAAIAADPDPVNQATIVAAISGNGSLTAGLDASGALTSLRWPGPGGPDQLRPADANRHELPLWYGGGRWAFEIDGKWYWQSDPRAVVHQTYVFPGSTIIETTIEWPDVGLAVRQRAGVLPETDVFVSAIEINKTPVQPRVIWVGDLSPSTHQLPEAAGSLDVLHGFAAVRNDGFRGRSWSFRPNNPSSADWARAHSLAAANTTTSEWDQFGDGVWLGIGGTVPARIRGWLWGGASFASSMDMVNDVLELNDPMPSAVVGRSIALFDFRETARMWITIGVGGNLNEAKRALSRDTRYSHDLRNVAPADTDTTFIAQAVKLSEQSHVQVLPHLAILNTLRDPKSGFTVRGLSADPPLARDWPRDGALVAWALYESGDHEAEERSIEAYLSLILTEEKPRRPYGSMPESVYTNGELASPHFVIDDRGPARVLWVAERMLASRGPNARAAWVQSHWKAIEAAAEFLSTWADARRGAPLYAKDPVGLADAETQDRLFAHFAGISAAIRLAGIAAKEVPQAWRVRRDQLQALCEWVLEEPGLWMSGGSLLLETQGISETTLASCAESCSRRLATLATSDREAAARLLLQISILKGEIGERAFEAALARLRVPNDGILAAPDSLVSAEILLAILLRGTR